MFAENKTSCRDLVWKQEKGNAFRAEVLKLFVAWTKEYRCKLQLSRTNILTCSYKHILKEDICRQ